ncbi:SNF2 helicase associated domain-containing protein [Paenibacillus sp. GD4]|uniref:DEAD/DEAH box helicase n=1 Tax=Paenibacillus sp. GD4 TaxID=3068890 RepID=UPI002796DEEC|nr:SNF2 helicase associated domain-containing protein [Paenibacillus sp. GD4]MDQ1910242.1 SNF2 helicase associated domain-containing protein [Paenibacillus sp. GD4]
MSFPLTTEKIKLLCGRFAYEEGEALYREGQVSLLPCDSEPWIQEAEVAGSRELYLVALDLDREGEAYAECSCPAYHPDDKYCAHIAAVLWNLLDAPPPDPIRSSEAERLLAAGMLDLFAHKPRRSSGARPLFDTRAVLQVEFICKPVIYGDGKALLGIEMKAGLKRLYPVQRIREFLEAVGRGTPFPVSRGFEYDPGLHSFLPGHDAVLRQLIEIVRNEGLYRKPQERETKAGTQKPSAVEIPPYAWETICPCLEAAPSLKIEQDGEAYEGIRWLEENLPLEFRFTEVQGQAEAYQLEVTGLERLVVLEEYRLVLSGGGLMKLPEEECRRVAELKRMLAGARRSRVLIAAEQAEPFMEKVVPGLMRLGSVRIEESVSERIVRTPLKARLYLDRMRERLLAALEFQYGDIIINPLEPTGGIRDGGRILMRDGEKEQRILELMELGNFTKTEAGYFMEEEESEYDFLYRIVPMLEKYAQVLATTAVKLRIHSGPITPTLKAEVDVRTDWLEFQFELAGIPESEIRKVLFSLQEKRRYHRLPDGSLLPLEGDAFQEVLRTFQELGLGRGDLTAAGIRVPAFYGLRLTERDDRSGALRLGKSLRRMLEHMRNPDHLEFPLPDKLAPVLRDYQAYGFQWMKTLARYRFGGILADDMGLGKTLQSIAFLVSVQSEMREQGQPALVVCPASLMYNWLSEIRKFAPQLKAVVADGSKQERSALFRDSLETDVLITSYPLLRRDLAWYAEQTFHTLILDEAQAFKNYTTQTAQAVREITARHRFALTGTPVENRLEELWSIYNGVFPELLPPLKQFQELSRESVARRIRPFLLRRLKSDVLKELPDKIETLQASELLPEQKKLYAAYLSRLQEETLKHLSTQGFDEKSRIRILAGLTRLRQLCCHPALFVQDYKGSSAKFEQLLELIDDCRSAGRRALVFSQFTEMLGLIGRELGYRDIRHFYLDGHTPSAERVELCRRFNEGEGDLFLISLKAGGTGLNLTGADTVILYDLWWNPAVEEQAAGRAHRIGQKNVVQVIRLVAQGTVEEKMYELQQRKKHLIEEIALPGQQRLSALTEQEVREILMLHP